MLEFIFKTGKLNVATSKRIVLERNSVFIVFCNEHLLNIRQLKQILNFETCEIITRKSDTIDSGIIQIIFHGSPNGNSG